MSQFNKMQGKKKDFSYWKLGRRNFSLSFPSEGNNQTTVNDKILLKTQ